MLRTNRTKKTEPPQEWDESEEQTTLKPGKITKISRQVKNNKRVSIYVEGEFAFGLAEDLVLQNILATGLWLSIERQQELIHHDQLYRAKGIALNFLSYKARTAHEVRKKLNEHDFTEETVEAVLERFAELGYIDDSAYANRFAQGRLNGKGYGPRRIREELRHRGVGREDITAAVDVLKESENTNDIALEQAQKRWSRLESERDPRKRRKKLFDFLLRRGFDFDTVRQAVEQVASQGS